jgi:hypothetical protein
LRTAGILPAVWAGKQTVAIAINISAFASAEDSCTVRHCDLSLKGSYWSRLIDHGLLEVWFGNSSDPIF